MEILDYSHNYRLQVYQFISFDKAYFLIFNLNGVIYIRIRIIISKNYKISLQENEIFFEAYGKRVMKLLLYYIFINQHVVIVSYSNFYFINIIRQ